MAPVVVEWRPRPDEAFGLWTTCITIIIAISNRIDLEGPTFETLILLSKFKVQVKMGRAVVDISLGQVRLVGQACWSRACLSQATSTKQCKNYLMNVKRLMTILNTLAWIVQLWCGTASWKLIWFKVGYRRYRSCPMLDLSRKNLRFRNRFGRPANAMEIFNIFGRVVAGILISELSAAVCQYF